MGKYVRLLQGLNHILFFSLFWFYSDITFFALGVFLYFVILCCGISVGFHRLFAHQTFNTSEFMEWGLLFLGTIATLGSSLAWVGLHLRHHSHSDKKEDPHSPCKLGKLKTWIGLWTNTFVNPKYLKHLLRQKKHQLCHKYYFQILFLWTGVLLFLFGLKGFVLLYCLPAVLCFHATSAVNVFGHGRKNPNTATKDFSTNYLWLALLTSGEGYHFNHHKAPGELRFGKWDPGYAFACLIKR